MRIATRLKTALCLALLPSELKSASETQLRFRQMEKAIALQFFCCAAIYTRALSQSPWWDTAISLRA